MSSATAMARESTHLSFDDAGSVVVHEKRVTSGGEFNKIDHRQSYWRANQLCWVQGGGSVSLASSSSKLRVDGLSGEDRVHNKRMSGRECKSRCMCTSFKERSAIQCKTLRNARMDECNTPNTACVQI